MKLVLVLLVFQLSFTSGFWLGLSDGIQHDFFSISTTWDGQPINHTSVNITIDPADDHNRVKVTVFAPFFDDPGAPNGTAGQPFPGLWDYEVAEAFFLNDHNQYLEVELSPHGEHLLLLLKAERDSFQQQLPMQYSSTISGLSWKGVAYIPSNYFPPKITKFNAYAIHGSGSARTYESLYPVPTGMYSAPDFHKLAYFQPIDFRRILPMNWSPSYASPEWDSVIAVG